MATDLERLLVTIEANTKQFERAINALPGVTDRAMAGVERSITASARRQSEAFQKSFVSGFGLGRGGVAGIAGLILGNFVQDSVKMSARAGNESSQAFLGYWTIMTEKLEAALGDSLIGGIGPALKATITDINNILTIVNEILAVNRQISSAFPAGSFSPAAKDIPLLGTELNLLNLIATREEAIRRGREVAGIKTPTLAAPKLGALEAPGAEQFEAFDKVMKDLIFEERQLGRTAQEQQVYNELKKAGVNIESEWGQAIALTTRQLYQEELALKSVKELNDGLEESTKTFVQGLIQGQSAAESFTAALRKMADALLDMALHSLFNPGGTPLLQSLFGGTLGLGQWGGGVLPGSGNVAQVGNSALTAGRMGGSGMAPQFHTNINVAGSVDQKTLGAMKGMIDRNNARQSQELQRNWGNHQSRYAALRGP